MKTFSGFVRAIAGILCCLCVPGIAVVVAADEPVPVRPDSKDNESPGAKQAKIYRARFEKVGLLGLADLTKDKDTSLALQASWETHKKIAPNSARYDPDGLKTFLGFLTDRTKAPVPEWWTKELLELRVQKGVCHLVDSDEKQPAIEKVKLGKETWRVRKGVTLTQRNESLTLKIGDESFEYPKDTYDLFRDSFADVGGEKVTCLAAYMSSGGHPFKVNGFENKGGKHLWTADVWAIERFALLGAGAGHQVEMTTKGDAVFVFGAEMWGMYVEAFDLGTGKCLFRFCTSYWGNWSEKWNLK